MKKVIKLSGCILLAVILGLSSCVKNDVAPEVAQLRQSQIAKLNAEVAQIIAETETVTIANAFAEAMNAITVQENQAQLDETLANLETALMEAKAELAASTLANEKAQVDLEIYLTDGAIKEIADQWFWYSDLLNNPIDGLYYKRLDLQQDIASAQLLLNSEDLPYDLVKSQLEATLARKESKLAATEAGLATLKGVQQDPATLEAVSLDLAVQLKDLVDQYDSLSTALVVAGNNTDAAQKLVDDANDLMDDYVSLVEDTLALVDDIAAEQKKITDANLAIAPLNTALNLLKANLTAKTTDLAAAQSAYNTKLTARNTAKTNDNNAQNLVASKLVAKNIAYNAWQGPPVVAANEAAYNTASTAYDNAVTAQGLTASALTDAENALTAANAVLTTAQTDYDNAFDAVYGVGGTVEDPITGSPQELVDAQNTIIADANDAISGFESDIDGKTAEIAELQSAYDDAVDNIDALVADVTALGKVETALDIKQGAVSDLILSLKGVRQSINSNISDIQTSIDNIESNIEGLKEDIADLETQIAENSFDKTHAEGEVVALQAQLADIEAQITQAEAMLASWKTKLEDAMAGK